MHWKWYNDESIPILYRSVEFLIYFYCSRLNVQIFKPLLWISIRKYVIAFLDCQIIRVIMSNLLGKLKFNSNSSWKIFMSCYMRIFVQYFLYYILSGVIIVVYIFIIITFFCVWFFDQKGCSKRYTLNENSMTNFI